MAQEARPMLEAKKYRQYAKDCVRIATSMSGKDRQTLLDIADGEVRAYWRPKAKGPNRMVVGIRARLVSFLTRDLNGVRPAEQAGIRPTLSTIVQKRTLIDGSGTSALCHKRTSRPVFRSVSNYKRSSSGRQTSITRTDGCALR